MFQSLFARLNGRRYFFILTPGHSSQIFASLASALRWLGNIGVTDTASVEVTERS